MRQFVFLPLIILMQIMSAGCSKPIPADVAPGDIEASAGPEQNVVENKEQFVINMKKGEFIIKPVAEYSISAIVIGKKSYSYGWQAELAPTDIALAWGKLADPESDKYVKYSQSDRWYFFEYKNDAPFSESYISTHSSNNHIIPASTNIRLAINSIKRKDKVMLKGFLVNVQGKYDNMDFWWNTSLTRNDSGDSSCEVFYVTSVKKDGYVYE